MRYEFLLVVAVVIIATLFYRKAKQIRREDEEEIYRGYMEVFSHTLTLEQWKKAWIGVGNFLNVCHHPLREYWREQLLNASVKCKLKDIDNQLLIDIHCLAPNRCNGIMSIVEEQILSTD